MKTKADQIYVELKYLQIVLSITRKVKNKKNILLKTIKDIVKFLNEKKWEQTSIFMPK